MGLLNKEEKDTNAKKFRKKNLFGLTFVIALKLIPLLLVATVVASVVNTIVKVGESKNTVDTINEKLEIEDVYDLVEIKGNDTDGYYLDFIDDIDDKLENTIKYLNNTAGVKSGVDKDFLKKIMKAEIYTQFPDLGGNIGTNSGFQGAVNIVRITPNKEINSLTNTGAGQETIIEQEENNSAELTNKEAINKQEEIIKKWNKGKKLTLDATAYVYSQEESRLNPGKKIDYWVPQKSEETQGDLKISENKTVTYTGNYSVSVNKMTNEGLIYIEIEMGDIKGYVKYSYISNDSSENDSNDIVDEEFIDSGYLEQADEKIVDTIDSNVYKMTYIPKGKFDEYMANADKTILNCFTLDDDGNLITAAWETKEDGTFEFKNNSTINLKSALQNLVMPYAYLMYFYINADYEDFSSDLADEVLKSEIIIAVEDNITTTNIKKTIEERKVSQLNEFSYDWTEKESTETTTEFCSAKVEVIYADTWCVKMVNSDIYNEELLNLDVGQSKNLKIPGKVTEATSSSISNETLSEEGNDTKEETETYVDSDGKSKTRKVTKNIPFKKYKHTVTNNHYISNSYASSNEVKEPESKENAFVDLYKEHKMYNRLNESRLLKILERDSRTANLVNLTKYLMYMATNENFGVKEYDFSEYKNVLFNSTGASGGSLSLTTPTLDKEDFVKALKEYANSSANSSFKTNFLPYAGDIYDWSVAAGVNPELVITTAKSEGNFGQAGGSFNYWGIGVYNGSKTGNSYSSFKEGIEGYAQVIASYRTGWKKSTIEDKARKRAADGVNPLGYGTPETLSGMQSLYSSLGQHVTGSSGKGGYYYMDPDVAGVTMIYSTHSEFLSKCKDSGLAEHAYGTNVTEWEDGQYTAWQVEQKLKTWNKIFGKYGTLVSGGNEAIVETANSKLGCPYVLGAKGPNSFDCSGFVWWVYNQNGINVPSSTDGYKSYIGSSKEISWNEAQPGDILIVTNTERGTTYGHAAIYLGNDSYIHAPQTGDVVKVVRSGAKNKFKHVFKFY